MREKKSFSESLATTISQEEVSILSDLGEIALDSVLKDGLLKDIPFVSTAISLYRIGNSIREREHIRKLASFLDEIRLHTVDESEREECLRKIRDNPKKRDKELEYALVIIDRYIGYDKPRMLAKLYLAFLQDVIDWERFTIYSEVIDRFLPGDYNTLKSASTYKTEKDLYTDSIQRLIALGLVIEGFRTMAVQEDDGGLRIDPPELREKNERNYSRTMFGNTLVRLMENEDIYG